MTATIVLPTYRVARVSAPGARNSYQVFILQEDGAWEPASKEYEHSTSAFAALGRLVQREVLKRLEAEK